MKARSALLIVFFLMVSFILTINGDGVSASGHGKTRTALLGGWEPIKDVKDPHIQEIAEFAVEEHNKEAKTEVEYKSVVRGKSQVVAGTNYQLVIAAEDGGVSKKYEAVVYERPWENFKNLTSFKQLQNV